MNIEKGNIKLKVTEIQRFCMHDGPGVRTTVFLKGCPLRCAWCHNPETQKAGSELLFYPSKCIFCGGCAATCKFGAHSIIPDREIDRERCVSCFDCSEICPTGALERCGEDMTVGEIVREIKKDSAFYGSSGGVTLSGGEPFVHGEAVLELLRACKAQGISTAVETCGYADTELLLKASELVDLFLFDVKDTDDSRHRKYTGVSNELILKNLNAVNGTGAKLRLRCILINGINTDQEHYITLARLAKAIRNFDGLEVIPYHAYGGTKSVFIGRADSGNANWIPTDEQILGAKDLLRSRGVTVI